MFDFHRDPGDETDYPANNAGARGKLSTDVVLGHPNLSDAINRNILGSAIAGGAKPSQIRGRGYKVTTANRVYTLLKDGVGWTIEGHPRYCPTATPCNIHGSTWGGSMLKIDFIGRGMHLEVGLLSGVMTTSPITEVEEIQ